MKKRFTISIIVFIFLINGNSLMANLDYKLSSLDKIHIMLFGGSECSIIDTLDFNGCFTIDNMKSNNEDLQFCLKGKTLLQSGNEIFHEVKKYYRVTERGFHFIVYQKESNYSTKIEIGGVQIRNKLISPKFLNKEFNLSDSILSKGMVFRDYSITFDLENKLKEESTTSLKSISNFLVKNDSLKIEIGVFFDERIEKVLSKRYSQGRAEKIMKTLISGNVDKSRLIAKGYEDKNPLIKNASSEQQHQKNRRVEFRIIEIVN